jgi:hypothetical protein
MLARYSKSVPFPRLIERTGKLFFDESWVKIFLLEGNFLVLFKGVMFGFSKLVILKVSAMVFSDFYKIKGIKGIV